MTHLVRTCLPRQGMAKSDFEYWVELSHFYSGASILANFRNDYASFCLEKLKQNRVNIKNINVYTKNLILLKKSRKSNKYRLSHCGSLVLGTPLRKTYCCCKSIFPPVMCESPQHESCVGCTFP